MRRLAKVFLAVFLVFFAPLGTHAAYWWMQERPASFRAANWSSAGVAPKPNETEEAVVLVYAARTGRWRGIFAVHSWVAVKERGAPLYTRYDVVGWGTPLRENAYEPDARWFSNDPIVVADIRGEPAEAMIPRIRRAVAAYPFATRGDYQSWPGPNSNTFANYVLAAMPEAGAALPSTAIGKDFPVDGRWFAPTPSRTGFTVRLGGYLGVTVGWVEGLEINLLGLVAGLDIRRPAVKLPGIGRVGI